MKKTPISIDITAFPKQIQPYINGAELFDSSCSPEAKVFYFSKGCFIKVAEKGTLKKEAELYRYFSSIDLAPKVYEYVSHDKDWLVTEQAKGEDLTHIMYLENPKSLAITLGETLAFLHSVKPEGCPEKNRLDSYFSSVEEGYKIGRVDLGFSDFKNPDDAYSFIEEYRHVLTNDTLIHGDYCLPNVIFNDWSFSSFIDIGNGGIGDRHIDIYWGAWTLQFNLKTNTYADLFFDAYGREKIDFKALKLVSACEIFG